MSGKHWILVPPLSAECCYILYIKQLLGKLHKWYLKLSQNSVAHLSQINAPVCRLKGKSHSFCRSMALEYLSVN